MDDLTTKCIGATGAIVKNAAQGIVEAVVARVGIKDHDGDVFMKGAFGSQNVRVSAYNHASWPQRGGLKPVGRGTIEERGEDVVATLKFFLNTHDGREHYELIKEMGDLQQWSYGWMPGNEKLAEVTPEMKKLGVRRAVQSVPVEEVSPVMIGASVGTRTVGVKECESCAGTKHEPAEVADADTRALVEQARANLAPRTPALEVPPSDRSGYARADFAAAAGRSLARRQTGRDAPASRVKFFARVGEHRNTAGFIIESDADETWVASDLSGEALVECVLHETMHHHQTAPALFRGPAEVEARAFVARWAPAVLAAFRATKGATHRLYFDHVREPPFQKLRGERFQSGDVILAGGRAWRYSPRHSNPWTVL